VNNLYDTEILLRSWLVCIPVPAPLVPSKPFRGIDQLKRWRLLVNARVEAEV